MTPADIDIAAELQRTLDGLFATRVTPRSTYRVQFHKNFTFRDAAAVVPYLKRLGISHLYASPYTKATPGSTHGYDVIDHQVLNPELGTQADYDALIAELSACEMGHILDIVPNHQGVATNENRWWNDVLKNGPASPFAGHFDINWQVLPPTEKPPRVLLPVLGKPYAAALAAGELKLLSENGTFFVAYFDRRFPVSVESVERFKLASQPLERFAAPDGDALDALLEAQHYRLAYWRVGPEEINYRRFFDVNDLAALAMEDQQTFDDAHSLILDLCVTGKVAGLRVDHPDGLRDPGQYFRRLQFGYVLHALRLSLLKKDADKGQFEDALRQAESLLKTWTTTDGIDGRGWPLYVVAEKILAPGEALPADWAVDGTSGYDFLNEAGGLFVNAKNADTLSHLYRQFTHEADDVEAGVYEAKQFMLRKSFATELNQLAHLLRAVASSERAGRDFSLATLAAAAAELIACFPVYRSYLGTGAVTREDITHLDSARARAEEHAAPAVKEAVVYVHALLLRTNSDFAVDEARATHAKAVARFQQLTAPVTAKGVEDTFFYRYQRLIALNEVGAEPGIFGLSPDDVHAYFADRQKTWPRALSVLSTHDTKRSEDLRARLYAVSEMPKTWEAAVTAWQAANQQWKTEVDGEPAPSAGDEYLFYQSLVGAWPADKGDWQTFVDRMQAFMLKALREAKTRTNWTDPNAAYEDAVKRFVAAVLDGAKNSDFLNSFEPFFHRVSHVGVFNSLSQTLIRLAAPGVPDTYQGTELFDFSLVDPDNRRPVEYDLRRKLLSERATSSATQDELAGILASPSDGRSKLLVTAQALALRNAEPTLFVDGAYVPLKVTGARSGHVFAFARVADSAAVVVIVPRLIDGLLQAADALAPVGDRVWGDTAVELPTTLAERPFTCLIGGRDLAASSSLRVADVLRDFPVGLLKSSRSNSFV